MDDAASRRVRGGDDRGAPGGPGLQGGAWPPGAAVTVAGGAEAAPGPGDAPASVATGGPAEPTAMGIGPGAVKSHTAWAVAAVREALGPEA